MGDSLYFWHGFGHNGAHPVGAPVAGRNPCPRTRRRVHVFQAVITFTRRRRRWNRPRRWVKRALVVYLLSGVDFSLCVVYRPFRGYYWSRLYRGVDLRATPVSTRDVPEYTVKRKDVRNQPSADGPSHLAAMESDVFSKLQNLVSHCAVTRYDDGTTRRTGWFTVKVMGAAWIVQVKDPDGACSMSLTAQTLDDALALADVMLGADDAPWEPDPFLKAQDARKKK